MHPGERSVGWRRRAGLAVAALAVTIAVPVTATKVTPAHADDGVDRQQRIGFHTGDDWEPAIAADRHGHLYVAYKHYDVPSGQTCPGCDLHVMVQRSSDGGDTWTAPRPIAPGAVVGGQYDPQIVVDPVGGRTIWASFLQNADSLIAVVRSDDFGATWSPPQLVSNRPPGLDKDALVVRGDTVAVAYDDNSDTWVSVTHNRGLSWSTHLVARHDVRHWISLSAGGGIDSRGDILFSWDSFDRAHAANGDGPVTLWVSRSTDGGAQWVRQDIDRSGAPVPCNPCGFAYLSAQMTLRIGSDDTVYLAWNGTRDLTAGAPARIFFSSSTDRGRTWAPRQDVSTAPPGTEHCFPALAVGARPGDVRVGWMDQRTGSWNVFLRASADAGESFGHATQLSGFVPGYPYLSSAGFALPYGDYFQLAVDTGGSTVAAFGEAPSYNGPGNIWFARR